MAMGNLTDQVPGQGMGFDRERVLPFVSHRGARDSARQDILNAITAGQQTPAVVFWEFRPILLLLLTNSLYPATL